MFLTHSGSMGRAPGPLSPRDGESSVVGRGRVRVGRRCRAAGSNEANRTRQWGVLEVIEANKLCRALDAHAEPDAVGGAIPVSTANEAPHPVGSFGDDLVDVLACAFHRVEHAMDEFVRDVGVEEIRHRADKDTSGTSPPGRMVEALGAELQVESVFVGVPGAAAKALGEAFGVAVITAGGDLRAADDWVPDPVGTVVHGVTTPVRDSRRTHPVPAHRTVGMRRRHSG